MDPANSRASGLRKPPIVIEPPKASVDTPATLIFIHGYNFVASQFNSNPPNHLSVAHHIHQSPLLQHVKVVIPEALPNVHKSMDKNTWYNIATPIPAPGERQDADNQIEFGRSGRNENDMNVTMDYFEELIQSEIAVGCPARRIVFMGDSQGASILTLFVLTRALASELGGVISYAGFPATPLQSVFRMQRENGLEGRWAKELKFFLLHGKNDVFVPPEVFRAWRILLEGFKDRGQGIAKLKWQIVDGMKHSLIAVIWPHVCNILQNVVPEVGRPGTYDLRTSTLVKL